MEKYSTVIIRETNKSKRVKISSDSKPKIGPKIVDKWQSLITTVAKFADVKSGLIMKLNHNAMEVIDTSLTEGNPYKIGDSRGLDTRSYCETVIGTQKILLIPNATKDEIWKKDNSAIAKNLISCLGAPINWPDGEVFGSICLLDDKENHYSDALVNLLKKLQQHLETDLEMLLLNKNLTDKNAQLSLLNNTKSRFLSLMSHDIRGSIGTINEFLNLILEDFDKLDKAELKPMLVSVSDNANSTFKTLETLLNWSKNDLVQLKPKKSKIDLVEITENILHFFEQEILLKKFIIKKEYYSNEIFVSADEKMMIVIMRNLISNAIKYTNNGGTIVIRMFESENNNIIEIEDTGIGMNKEAVNNLFSYDESHSKQGTNGEASSGIGLMIAKEFMDKNDIDVYVESKLGAGSIFRLKM